MSNEKNAQELLKWGLANSTAAAPGPSVDQISADIAAGNRPDLADPRLYDAIMGKSETQMMREELAAAVDESRTVEDRCTALDNFEMLIEQIDNANNITSMKMWPPIIALLSSEEPRIQTATAWILGTAVQNNDKAQIAVLEFQPLAPLLDLLHSHDFAVRSKAMYALSGLLKHNPAAVDQFEKMNGWKYLQTALLDPNITLRRKTAFLINTLLFQDPSVLSVERVAEAASSSSASAATTASQSTDLALSTVVTPSQSRNTTSTATAVAPTTSSPNPSPPVPLERGPETMLTGIKHPNVAQALLSSGVLATLISSLLAPGTLVGGVTDADADTDSDSELHLLPPPSGPDGDTDQRLDLDFAEKAATSIITFVTKIPGSNPGDVLPSRIQALLKALNEELAGPPLDDRETFTSRHQELGIDATVFADFQSKIAAL
ncbi:Fes1-domain-containing protein [Testicularia cyperi]|uniref:Fes1-domain-containing protein n=1 Tax=Testicularia cyperi TaxID=1882483 RepID=A0A317XIX2_9BASI|nr:Fes1-domain-containing protein [Testicularia cyperi]